VGHHLHIRYEYSIRPYLVLCQTQAHNAVTYHILFPNFSKSSIDGPRRKLIIVITINMIENLCCNNIFCFAYLSGDSVLYCILVRNIRAEKLNHIFKNMSILLTQTVQLFETVFSKVTQGQVVTAEASKVHKSVQSNSYD
jgi:hypothetical protein